MSCHELAKMPASCPMHQKLKVCHKDGPEEEEKDGCCQNQSEYFVLDQDQQIQNLDFPALKNLEFLATIFIVFSIDLPTFDNAKLHYLNYKPPLIVCDFRSSLQTFLL